MRGRCSPASGLIRGGRIGAALGRCCCKSPRGGARPGKFDNNRIRMTGSVNQNSRFDLGARKLFFVPAPKIVLQQYRPNAVIERQGDNDQWPSFMRAARREAAAPEIGRWFDLFDTSRCASGINTRSSTTTISAPPISFRINNNTSLPGRKHPLVCSCAKRRKSLGDRHSRATSRLLCDRIADTSG
jgi:hypothetical protein